eukprot:c42289_g1_i1.p2 GENE.c42289_g1_i1~~c42289_g1_i1.p2  ORF type:complete len:100 (-),score=12.22 c42289_g1_i1:19-297(-)
MSAAPCRKCGNRTHETWECNALVDGGCFRCGGDNHTVLNCVNFEIVLADARSMLPLAGGPVVVTPGARTSFEELSLESQAAVLKGSASAGVP